MEHWQYNTCRAFQLMPALERESTLATSMLDPRGNVAKVDGDGLGEFTRKAQRAPRAAAQP
jgi:hypothetical protein